MRLDRATWHEADAVIARVPGIILPTGSTEQHGPIGLIGTDALCAQTIAEAAADKLGCLAAPTLAYTPAPFNMAFPGTVSVSEETFRRLFAEVALSFRAHGIALLYVLNGHGANLDPLRRAAGDIDGMAVRIRSWWDFEAVNALRRDYYGDWEGMHATPSEIAITQAVARTVSHPDAADPPRRLSPEYIAAHGGDRHGPPADHRRDFPDGRVGSHSALAHPAHGRALIDAATEALVIDFERALARK